MGYDGGKQLGVGQREMNWEDVNSHVAISGDCKCSSNVACNELRV